MSQTFRDWEFKEAVNKGNYRYEIFKAETIDNKKVWRGFVIYKDGSDNWFENDSIEGLRMTLISMGQQHP